MLISASWQASSASDECGSTPRQTLRARGRTAPSNASSASRSPVCARRARSSISSGVVVSQLMPASFPRRHDDNAYVSIPSRIGRYAVRRRIGSGAFATVWLAYDEQLDSPVAVKVLAENWTEDQHVRQRFLE